LALCLGWLLVAGKCFADLPKPPVPPPNAQPSDPSNEVRSGRSTRYYKATTDPAKEVSVLRIPRKELDAIVAENARKQTSAAPLRTQSIIAALAASIGVASVVFLRMNRQTKVAMLFVVGLVGSSAAADAWWNISRPPDLQPRQSKGSIEHSGPIVVEVTDTGSMELTIGTKSHYATPLR